MTIRSGPGVEETWRPPFSMFFGIVVEPAVGAVGGENERRKFFFRKYLCQCKFFHKKRINLILHNTRVGGPGPLRLRAFSHSLGVGACRYLTETNPPFLPESPLRFPPIAATAAPSGFQLSSFKPPVQSGRVPPPAVWPPWTCLPPVFFQCFLDHFPQSSLAGGPGFFGRPCRILRISGGRSSGADRASVAFYYRVLHGVFPALGRFPGHW